MQICIISDIFLIIGTFFLHFCNATFVMGKEVKHILIKVFLIL